MNEQQKQLIKDLYKEGSYTKKELIKEAFPEMFKLLETGWLKSKSTDTILYRCGNNLGYGKYRDDWVGRSAGYSFEVDPENWQPAPKEEVKEMLIKEAKRRGVWDCPIIDVNKEQRKRKGLTEVVWVEERNRLWSAYGLVFDNGKWATPIAQSKTETIHLFGNMYKISLIN